MTTLVWNIPGMEKKVDYVWTLPEDHKKEQEEKLVFLTKSFYKEVIEGATQKEKKKRTRELKRLLQISMTTLAIGLGMGIGTNAHAATGSPKSPPITPDVVMEWGLMIALIVVSAGAALSMILLSVAGIYRMFRKRKETAEWNQDIIKGAVQVLVAIPTIYLLYFIAQLVFKKLPMLSGLF